MTCSICGKDMKKHGCKHIKGTYYGKKLCHGILNEAKDAYEWSFVAVPAQKNAGVTKAFDTKTTKAFTDDGSFTADNDTAVFSKSYVKALEKQADDGRLYREHLAGEIRKYALITMNKVNIDAFISHCGNMDTTELKSLAEGLKAQANEIIPVSPQLRTLPQRKTESDNNSFKI